MPVRRYARDSHESAASAMAESNLRDFLAGLLHIAAPASETDLVAAVAGWTKLVSERSERPGYR